LRPLIKPYCNYVQIDIMVIYGEIAQYINFQLIWTSFGLGSKFRF
jgi:hypothetical protein